MSQKEGWIYRLLTTTEFEYSARGRFIRKKYLWGDASSGVRANFYAKGNRPFD